MNLRMLGSDFHYRSIKSKDDGTLIVEDVDFEPWINGSGDLVFTLTTIAMDVVGEESVISEGGVKKRMRATLARSGKHKDMLSVRIDDSKGYELSLSDVDKMINTMFEDAAEESGDPIE